MIYLLFSLRSNFWSASRWHCCQANSSSHLHQGKKRQLWTQPVPIYSDYPYVLFMCIQGFNLCYVVNCHLFQ